MTTRACALPGTVFVQADGRLTKAKINKTHCGTLVRVTTINAGDIRRYGNVAVIRVNRRDLFVPIKQVRLGRAGRGR